MSRRAPLPGAAELFRSTERSGMAVPAAGDDAAVGWFDPAEPPPQRNHQPDPRPARRTSGRQKHPCKITVYVSDEELLALEHARLALRGAHGLAVDRGRMVREAIAVLLADFDDRGEDSVLVRRLRQDEQQ